jgi:DNA-binding response OmpR family regulator
MFLKREDMRRMKRKIMVVDNDSDITYSIRKRLNRLNAEYEVIGADSGIKCIGLLYDNYIPDLILLDVMMPDMDGIDVFRKLKENPLWKKIPTVFLVDEDDGFNEFFIDNILDEDYIVKPFDPDVFVKWVEKRFLILGVRSKEGE